jgi:hypothetical protein
MGIGWRVRVATAVLLVVFGFGEECWEVTVVGCGDVCKWVLGKKDTPEPAVGVDLDSEGLGVVCLVGFVYEKLEVELDLVPAVVELQRHC